MTKTISGYEVKLHGAKYADVFNPKTEVMYQAQYPYLNTHRDHLIYYETKSGAVRSLKSGGPMHKKISAIVNEAIK